MPVRLAFFVSLLLLSGCADGKSQASADCDARSVEYKLVGIDKARHKNLCMLSHGYKRTTRCNSGYANLEAKICYSPSWHFWEEEAILAE